MKPTWPELSLCMVMVRWNGLATTERSTERFKDSSPHGTGVVAGGTVLYLRMGVVGLNKNPETYRSFIYQNINNILKVFVFCELEILRSSNQITNWMARQKRRSLIHTGCRLRQIASKKEKPTLKICLNAYSKHSSRRRNACVSSLWTYFVSADFSFRWSSNQNHCAARRKHMIAV